MYIYSSINILKSNIKYVYINNTMVNFTQLVTSNMTCVGTIYGDEMLFDTKNSNISGISEYRVNIFMLAEELSCNDHNISFIKYIDSIKIKVKYNDRYIHTKYNKYKNPWYESDKNEYLVSASYKDKDVYYIYNDIYFVVAIFKGDKHISKNTKKKKTIVFVNNNKLLHSTEFIEYYRNPWYIADNDKEVPNLSTVVTKEYKITYKKKQFKIISYLNKSIILDIPIVLDNKTLWFDIYKNPWYGETNTNDIIIDGIKYSYNGSRVRLTKLNDNISDLKNKTIKKRMDFVNSFSIEFKLSNDRVANCKISTNGRVQITGCSDIKQIYEVYNIIDREFSTIMKQNIDDVRSRLKSSKMNDNMLVSKHILLDITSDKIFNDMDMISLGYIREHHNNYYESIKKELLSATMVSVAIRRLIFSHKIRAQHRYTAMKMCHFKSTDLIEIDQIKMFNYIKSLNRYDLNPIFGNSKNKSLQVDYITSHNTITYVIFRSCKINMTNVKSDENAIEGYKFITNFISDNIQYFTMENYLMNVIDVIIDDSKKGIVQGSKEWLDSRKNCITASDAFKVIMKDPPFGQSLNGFILDKASFLLTGKSSFEGNEYTQFGHYFEPIAQQILVRHYNETKPFKSCLYETGLIISKKSPFIGASPDGILFKFRNDLDIKYSEKVDIIKLKEIIIANEKEIKDNTKIKQQNLLLDVSLVEIKCPSKTFKHIEKSVLEEKPHYYWQMQQQMYTIGVNNVVFMQCLFKYYESRDSYLEDDKRKYKGSFYIVDKKAYHPLDVLSDCPEITGIEKKYWYLEDCDMQDVLYDKKYETYLSKMEDTMKKIQTTNPFMENPYSIIF